MKVEIEIKYGLSGMVIKDKKKIIEWQNLSREEQISILNSLSQFYNLFSKFLKEE